MLNHLKSVAKSRFVRNVFIVATGTAGAQAITMAFAPITTRIYGPEAFGLLGTFMAILAIATPIAALTYPIAIVLPKSDQDALGLAKLSAGLAVLMAALIAVLILLVGDALAELLGLQNISSFLLLIPVGMLLSAFHQILQQWLIRKKQFKTTAKVAILQTLILNSAKVGVGWFHPVGTALILLATIGSALHTALLWLGIRKRLSAHPDLKQVGILEKACEAITVKALARRHIDFPLYRAPQVAINALSQSLPVLMLASFFGPAAAGLYSIAKMALGAPVMLLGQSVSTVFYPKFNEAFGNNENTNKVLLKAIGVLALVGIIPFGLIIFLGPFLFGLVFGEGWIQSGIYAQWMAVWLYFMLITRPVIAAIPVLSIQRFFLIYEIVGVPVRVGALFLGFYLYESSTVSIALFCLINSVMYIVLTFKALAASKRSA